MFEGLFDVLREKKGTVTIDPGPGIEKMYMRKDMPIP